MLFDRKILAFTVAPCPLRYLGSEFLSFLGRVILSGAAMRRSRRISCRVWGSYDRTRKRVPLRSAQDDSRRITFKRAGVVRYPKPPPLHFAWIINQNLSQKSLKPLEARSPAQESNASIVLHPNFSHFPIKSAQKPWINSSKSAIIIQNIAMSPTGRK